LLELSLLTPLIKPYAAQREAPDATDHAAQGRQEDGVDGVSKGNRIINGARKKNEDHNE